MLDFWRLDTKDNDFFLVKSPSLALSAEVRAYHLELLNRVRAIPDYQEIEELIFEQSKHYYSKVANLLGFDIDKINDLSRIQFFIAFEKTEDYWISGLEVLMGYSFSKSSTPTKDPSITSGKFTIDLLAELLLLPDVSQVKWLYETQSPSDLLKLINQMRDRSRGQAAIDEINKQKDLDFLTNPETLNKLQEEGLGL